MQLQIISGVLNRIWSYFSFVKIINKIYYCFKGV